MARGAEGHGHAPRGWAERTGADGALSPHFVGGLVCGGQGMRTVKPFQLTIGQALGHVYLVIRQCKMVKRIMPGFPIYVAHQMRGDCENGSPKVKDESRYPSPKELAPTLLVDKIEIYERQVKGWFLEPATLLFDLVNFQASFVIIAICFSYLEGVEQYRQGKASNNRSFEFFSSSFKRIFGDNALDGDELKKLYKQGRCGLFHDGMTQSDVIADMELDVPITTVWNSQVCLVHFHPKLLLEHVAQDFDDYIMELREDLASDLSKNFDKMYDLTGSKRES